MAGLLDRGDTVALRDDILAFGARAPIVSLLVMIAQALVPPIPSFLVIFANGLAFGLVWGGLLGVVRGTLASLVAFAIARALGCGLVEALVGRAGLASADRWFALWGGWAIVLARLVPGTPVDAVSYAAGLPRMPAGQFFAATVVVGMLPQALLYAHLGQRAPQYLWALSASTLAVMGGGAAAAFLLRCGRGGRRVSRDE